MDLLLKEVEERLNIINGLEQEEESMKSFSVRLPISLIEDLEKIGSKLQMKKTVVVRMILTHGVDEVLKKIDEK